MSNIRILLIATIVVATLSVVPTSAIAAAPIAPATPSKAAAPAPSKAPTPTKAPGPTPTKAPTPAPKPASVLKSASNFAVLAGTVVVSPTEEAVFGDIGAKSGLMITAHPGIVHPANDAATVAALRDTQLAYTGLTGRPAPIELANGDLSGSTLTPGSYHSVGALTAADRVVFDAQNHPDAVFVVRTDANVNIAPGMKMVLINGAKSSNIYWLAGTTVTLGNNSTFDGNILANAAVTVGSNSIVNGRTISINNAVIIRAFCVIGANIVSPLNGSN